MSDGKMDTGAPRSSPSDEEGTVRACLRRPHGQGEDEKLWLWPDGPTIVGRTRSCDHKVESRFLSRQHFAVLPSPRGFLLLDLDSRNGTFLNDAKTKIALLQPGDVVRAGSRILIFEIAEGDDFARCAGCSRRMGPAPGSGPDRVCLACRTKYVFLGETVAGVKMTGALGDRPGLVDYAAFYVKDSRELRVRAFMDGAPRRALKTMAAFECQEAVGVHERARHEGAALLVTERPPRVPLALLTEIGLPAPLGLVGKVMDGVANVMARAHARGLRHGLLRAECIGIAPDGSARVDDLGVYDILRPVDQDSDWFVPPERRGLRKKSLPTDDIYAFGAVYYRALTRRAPSPDYASGRVDAARPLAERRPDLPGKTAFLIGRALASDPRERYRSFDEILADLE